VTSQANRRGLMMTAIGIVIVAIYLFPVYWMVISSLKTTAGIFAYPPEFFPSKPTLDAYREAVFENDVVRVAIRNSAIIATGTMILTLFLAAPAAYALARLRLPGGLVVLLLLLIAQLLPAIVIATPLFVLFSQFDPFGLMTRFEWLSLISSYHGLIIANTTATLPFAVIVLRPFFLAIPRELESAAMVDGDTRFGAFRRIVLPLVRPGLLTVAVFSFLIAWGEFVFALSLNNQESKQPITVAMNAFIGQYGTEWNNIMAVATTVAIPILIVFAALQRFIVGGITAGATKE
jgi:multiple sugar transport system permease protein